MIEKGDRIPDVTLMRMTSSGPIEVSTAEYCKGRKVVLFGVPGAFTPTCSESHVPGFLSHAGALHDAGIEAIACISTADFFVMDAWGKSLEVGDTIDMLGDGNHEFVEATGFTLDLSARGLGQRSQRYSMVVDDGEITYLAIEDNPGIAKVSGAEALLDAL